MLELLGGAVGGLLRLAPEILKIKDRQYERQHELAMIDKNIEADKLKGQLQLAQTKEVTSQGETNALVEAVKAQATLTGIKWVDAINSLMRPLITFWWVIVLYTGVLYVQWAVLKNGGVDPFVAITQVWGSFERGIVASIVGFWFVDRVIRNQR